MVYRICKMFEVESGHMLSRHPERCRFPHGHTRRVELVVESRELDENGMVVDFKALKIAVAELIDRYDHALCVHVDDPLYPALVEHYGGPGGRIIAYHDQDPTSEVIARELFEAIAPIIEGGGVVRNPDTGAEYKLPSNLKLRSLRLWETTSSWAEVVAD